MTTLDQKLVELIQEKLNINGWPWGNFLLSAIAILLTVFLFHNRQGHKAKQ